MRCSVLCCCTTFHSYPVGVTCVRVHEVECSRTTMASAVCTCATWRRVWPLLCATLPRQNATTHPRVSPPVFSQNPKLQRKLERPESAPVCTSSFAVLSSLNFHSSPSKITWNLTRAPVRSLESYWNHGNLSAREGGRRETRSVCERHSSAAAARPLKKAT